MKLIKMTNSFVNRASWTVLVRVLNLMKKGDQETWDENVWKIVQASLETV